MGVRFDIGQKISEVSMTPHGYMLIKNAYPTRTGVLNYRRDGRLHRELRPPEEIVKVLPQIAHAPITNAHRKAGPEDLKHFEGVSRSDVVLQDDGWVRTSVEVMAAQAIKDINENKRRHLSGGYDKVSYDETPGWWDPSTQTYRLDSDPLELASTEGMERFDGIQRDLEYSHAMLCEVSRAGEGAGIRYDSFEDDDEVETFERVDEEEEEMKVKITLNGIEYEVEEPIARAFQERHDSTTGQLDGLTEERDALVIERDELKKTNGELTGEVKALKADAEKRHDSTSVDAVNERMRVVSIARKVGVDYLQKDPTKCDKTNDEIMRDAVEKRYDSKEISDDEVVGMFRGLEFDTPATFDDVFTAAEKEEGASRHDEGTDYDKEYAAFCARMDGKAKE